MLLKFRSSRFYLKIKTCDRVVFLTMRVIYCDEIDYFVSMLADDFIDEHVKFKFVNSEKSKLREDMISKLNDEVIYSSIEINEIMVGADVVFVKMTESGKVKPAHLNKTIEHTKTCLLYTSDAADE